MGSNTLYENDLYAWANAQAGLLRAGRLDELDVQHLAEEIEAVGSSEHREMRRRLARLVQHLLKFDYQPEHRSRSWLVTISRQRAALEDLLAVNASLRAKIDETLPTTYRLGRIWALQDNGLLTLPETCPYGIEHIMAGDLPPLG